MRKSIIIVSLIGALLIILDSLDAANSIMLFLFAGVIPGTDLLISPIDMMAATATAITIVILRITMWSRVKAILFAPTPIIRGKRTKRTA